MHGLRGSVSGPGLQTPRVGRWARYPASGTHHL